MPSDNNSITICLQCILSKAGFVFLGSLPVLQEEAEAGVSAQAKTAAGQNLANGIEPEAGSDPKETQPSEAVAPILMTTSTAVRRFKFTLQAADHELDAQVSFRHGCTRPSSDQIGQPQQG